MFIKRFFPFALAIVIISALVVGFYPLEETVSVHAAKQDANVDKFDGIESFSQVIGLIKNGYVEEIDEDLIFQGAIKGMLLELDPHSSYFTPKQYKSFMTDMKGEFGGLGMTVGMQDGALTVIAPIEDTPAFKAGLKSGDYIIKIDEASTTGMSTDEAVGLMRGKPKTRVKLTVIRKNEMKPLEFTITRDIIKIKSVKFSMLAESIGYVRFTSFQENSSAEVRNALAELNKQGAKGTILDLRNNPGGSLAEAVRVASLFLPSNKVVVVTKNRDGTGQSLSTKSLTYRDIEYPLVILVNEGSASASEIVAGAMQDYKRALVVGTTTFGKASVQTVFDLRDGGAIKLTTARYYTPKNRSIQGVGIVPDVVVPQGQIIYNENNHVRKERDLAGHLVGEEEKNTASIVGSENVNTESDLQLQSAIQMIKGMALYGNNEI